jgi:hypothetical protein
MAKQRDEPRISVNKLAQYVTSRATRQNQILRTAKFPPEYITAYYRDASEAIARLQAPHLIVGGVKISVRPEVTLHSKSKGGEDLVGGIKLHFPKTEPMDEEQASLVSALINAFCKDHLWKDGAPLPSQCMVIDLASGKVYPGVKSIKQRLKDVDSACGQIASLWPGITQ